MKWPWSKKPAPGPDVPAPEYTRPELLSAMVAIRKTPEGRLILAWLKTLAHTDFLAYRQADSLEAKRYVDGRVDRTQAILAEIEGADKELASLKQELRNAGKRRQSRP